jgi:plasmid rolling circle replication initiator protein Rep
LVLAAAYEALGELKRAGRVNDCGSYLWFLECVAGHKKKLIKANFCRERLCPMCAFRRSLLLAYQVRRVAHAALLRRPALRFILLTPTIPNVPAERLSEGVTSLLEGWKRLTERAEVKSVLEGSFRAVEVTRSKHRGDYHPHLHALLAVPPKYFDGKNYLSRDRWLDLWCESTRMPEITQLDVRVVKPKGSGDDALAGAAAEVAKYAVKPGKGDESAFIRPTMTATAEAVSAVHNGLRGRRLVQYGGLFRELHRELNLSDADAPSSDELVTITGEEPSCFCSVCGSEMEEHKYMWRGGLTGDYVG